MDKESFFKEFEASYLAATGANEGYVCPLCLEAFTASEDLTWEHVPPESVGGRRLVLVCPPCNHVVGGTVDKHFDRLKNWLDFSAAYPGTTSAILGHGGTRLRIALADDETTVRIDERQDIDQKEAAMQSEKFLHALAAPGGTEGKEIELTWPDTRYAWNQKYLEVAFLKAAYLAIFRDLKYAAILSKAYDAVRQQVREPNRSILPLFVRKTTALSTKPVIKPLWHTGPGYEAFLVYFGGFATGADTVVLLPTPDDDDLTKYRGALTPAEKIRVTCGPADQRAVSS